MIGPQATLNGFVAIDANTTRSDVDWDLSLARTNDSFSRIVMPSWGSVRRSTQSDEKA